MAYQEAISHLTSGLDLLQTLPETLERDQKELPLQTALGAASIIVRGHAASEVEVAYTRARALCQQLGDTQGVFPVLYGLWRFYTAQAALPLARQLGEELLTLAERKDETPLYVEAYEALGIPCFYLGELLPAHNHLEAGVTCDTPAQRCLPLLRTTQDPGVDCRIYAACTLWLRGYPDHALARAHDALALATELNHPYSDVFALDAASLVCQFRREGQDVYDRTETAVRLSIDQGFTVWLALSTILRGWALMARGQLEEGLTQIRQGLTDWRATGAELLVPYFLTLMAEGYGTLKQVEAGLDALNEGIEVMAQTGERWYQAEIYCLKGKLLLQQSSDSRVEAESCFHQAISIAQNQQAKSWELRAATSLARLWHQQGKHQEAYDLLAPVYGWFTEGFDTADLIDAMALLDELVEVAS